MGRSPGYRNSASLEGVVQALNTRPHAADMVQRPQADAKRLAREVDQLKMKLAPRVADGRRRPTRRSWSPASRSPPNGPIPRRRRFAGCPTRFGSSRAAWSSCPKPTAKSRVVSGRAPRPGPSRSHRAEPAPIVGGGGGRPDRGGAERTRRKSRPAEGRRTCCRSCSPDALRIERDRAVSEHRPACP